MPSTSNPLSPAPERTLDADAREWWGVGEPETMGKGWICLHRRLLDHPRFRDAEWLSIWTYLLLSATHRDYATLFDGKRVVLKPGQLITGRHSIAEKTGVNASKVFRVLERLKSEQQISQQAGAKNSIITIMNWHKYQHTEQENEQPASSNRAAAEHKQQQEQQEQQNDKTVGAPKAAPASAKPMISDDWLGDLKADRAYAGLDVDRQLGKMKRYCEVNHKQPTRRRFINWLNRCDVPLRPSPSPENALGSFKTGTIDPKNL